MYSLVRYELRYIPDPKGVSGPHLPDGMLRVLDEEKVFSRPRLFVP